jgi:hypothetical protein
MYPISVTQLFFPFHLTMSFADEREILYGWGEFGGEDCKYFIE